MTDGSALAILLRAIFLHPLQPSCAVRWSGASVAGGVFGLGGAA